MERSLPRLARKRQKMTELAYDRQVRSYEAWNGNAGPRSQYKLGDIVQWRLLREHFVELSVCLVGVRITWTRDEDHREWSEYLEWLIIQAWRMDVEGDPLGFLFGSVRPSHRQPIVLELTVPLAQLADDLPLEIVSQSDESPVPHVLKRTLALYLQWSACLEEPGNDRNPPSQRDYLSPWEIIDPAYFRDRTAIEDKAIAAEEEEEEEEDDEKETPEEGSYSEHSEGEQSEEEEEEEQDDEEEELESEESEWEIAAEEGEQAGAQAEGPEAARKREEIAVAKRQLEFASEANQQLTDDPARDPEPPKPEDGDPAAETSAAPARRRRTRWLSGLVQLQGYGHDFRSWAASQKLEDFLKMVEDGWHDLQEAQKATDAILTLHTRQFKSVRDATDAVERLICVPGVRYDPQINGEKCEFGRTRILYLGHEISAEGLKPDDAKVASIRDWPRPQFVTKMRSFLGMTGYYRTFVKNYSIMAAPLTDLTRLDTPWEWTDKCGAAFRHLKHALTHYEVLKLPDPDKPFMVTTDANQYGIGAVLAQQNGPKLRPVEYMSKKMPSQKLAKSTYEKELYAVYKALTHWRHYLLGRFFILRTDHQTLRWMRTQPVLSDALKRWIEVIEQYDFDPQYLKGEYNKVADALSRRPDFSGALIIEFDLTDNVTQSLVEAYRQDQFMSEIIRRLEVKDKKTSAEFELVNGLLFLEKAGNKHLSHLALIPLGSLILTMLVCVLTASSLSWLVAKWIIAGAKDCRGRKLRLAPGPAPWPIVGNLLQLQRHPHRVLAKMAEQYGELMTIHMGTALTLVVSSPAAAKEVLLTQGTTFASRPLPPTADAWSHGGRSLGLAPYGPLWRKQTKIASVQFFSPRRMAQVDAIRRKLTNFLEEELLRKGQGGAQKQEGSLRNVGTKEAAQEGNGLSPAAAPLLTETTSSSLPNPATAVHVGATTNVETSHKDRQVAAGGICHPAGNEWGPSGAAGTMHGLQPVHLRENLFHFALDTLTYVIFGSPVSPAMQHHMAKAIATSGSSTSTMTMPMRAQEPEDGLEDDATRRIMSKEASLHTMEGGKSGNDVKDDQMAKGFYDVVLSMMQMVGMVQIPDFVPSLCCTTLDHHRAALREAGLINPDAMVDTVFNNLSPSGMSTPKNLVASTMKDNDVVYGETETCLLLMGLVAAGTDTTTSTTVFALMELLRHPEKLALLKAELDEAIGMHKVPSENDLENLPYLNAFLYETLRMHSVSPMLLPHQAMKDAVVFGYDVPAGTTVLVNVWAIMHDPKVWSEPWEFRPERFIRDGLLADDMHPDGKNFEFFPFGSGRRICPGIRLALTTVRFVVSRLLQRFDVMLPHDIKPEDLDLTEQDGLVIFPENPVPVIFRPRSMG
ncbi:hypothetical protein CBR_g12415 [Chara braunii]|uniref:Reverse transcriptase/retrotransposon-derived protein RNase H-like domain-containing protein n=1 Tax=Chara braunii TaxID=69332 RepID=A0A388JS87_CHABU|nr:hypothetical protein CBR_g12415 [Chara braunii]|eukprot:GBG60679.1 hypothetical protein CBR_g12415 [Chara braunii]